MAGQTPVRLDTEQVFVLRWCERLFDPMPDGLVAVPPGYLSQGPRRITDMAAVIVPHDNLRIPEHLRGRLQRPALRLVAPPGAPGGARGSVRAGVRAGVQAGAVVALRPASTRPAFPGAAVHRRPARSLAPAAVLEPAGGVVRRWRAGTATIVVGACLAVVALTGAVALAAGTSTPAPAPAPSAAVSSAAVAAMEAGVWVVQPGDSLWSIAAALAPGADLRPVVDDLAGRSEGGALQPGQRIPLDGLYLGTP